MKKKSIAGILALIFGIFGVHHFYLGQRARGILHFLLFLFTFAMTVDGEGPFIMLPFLIGFIGGILLLVMPDVEFNEKYNSKFIRSTHALRPGRAAPAYQRVNLEMKQLKQDGIQAFRAREYDLATEIFLDALEIDPCDPAVHFNLACCYSEMKIVDLADEHLQEALENGFERWDKIDKHASLKWYREQNAYLLLLKRFQAQPAQDLPSSADQLDLKPTATTDSNSTGSTLDTVDLLEQISRLGELRERGILTEEEFSMQKKRILGQ